VRAIAVDWSGRQTGEASFIWLAEAVDGELIRLEGGRDRAQLANELIRTIHLHGTERANEGGSLVVGLDFSFSFPAWFFSANGVEQITEMWELVAEHGEAWLASCPAPFWGRPGKPRPTGFTQFRQCEHHIEAVSGIRPKSTFQIGGAGSVGTGSIRGIPMLLQLQRAGASIWPFDQPSVGQSPVTVCEIYPRVLTGPVKKSSDAARLDYLQSRQLSIPDAERSEDAFDAAISAIELSRRGAPPPVAATTTNQLEGLIWPDR
jgi:hypothetical protein